MSTPHTRAAFEERRRQAHAALRAGRAATAETWLRGLEAQGAWVQGTKAKVPFVTVLQTVSTRLRFLIRVVLGPEGNHGF